MFAVDLSLLGKAHHQSIILYNPGTERLPSVMLTSTAWYPDSLWLHLVRILNSQAIEHVVSTPSEGGPFQSVHMSIVIGHTDTLN